MPAHNLNLADPQAVLRILLTLVEHSEQGEVRFNASDYDELDKEKLLVVDFDRKKGQIVIRATTSNGAVVKVTPEAQQWTLPISAAPLERARLRAERDAELRTVPSDEILADMEEDLARRQTLAREVEEGKSPTRIRIRP